MEAEEKKVEEKESFQLMDEEIFRLSEEEGKKEEENKTIRIKKRKKRTFLSSSLPLLPFRLHLRLPGSLLPLAYFILK